LPVFAGFTGFFHCPGKNTFCRGKNPTVTDCKSKTVMLIVINYILLERCSFAS